MSTDYTKAEQAGMDNFKNMSPENKVPSLLHGMLDYFKQNPSESTGYREVKDYIRGWERGFEIYYRKNNPSHLLPQYENGDIITVEMEVVDQLFSAKLFSSMFDTEKDSSTLIAGCRVNSIRKEPYDDTVFPL